MTDLQSSITRLSLFRGSFPDGQICEETGLSTDDLDVILKAMEGPVVEQIARRLAEQHVANYGQMEDSDLAMYVGRAWRNFIPEALAERNGIPILSTSPGGNLQEENCSTTCVTCGGTFSLNDPEAVSFHDTERHEPKE